MDISIPLQLKQFIEKKVKNGLYSSEDEVVCDALRALKERDAQSRSSATRQGAVSVSWEKAISKRWPSSFLCRRQRIWIRI
jgi:putative addiction module CopG family antidote